MQARRRSLAILAANPKELGGVGHIIDVLVGSRSLCANPNAAFSAQRIAALGHGAICPWLVMPGAFCQGVAAWPGTGMSLGTALWPPARKRAAVRHGLRPVRAFTHQGGLDRVELVPGNDGNVIFLQKLDGLIGAVKTEDDDG